MDPAFGVVLCNRCIVSLAVFIDIFCIIDCQLWCPCVFCSCFSVSWEFKCTFPDSCCSEPPLPEVGSRAWSGYFKPLGVLVQGSKCSCIHSFADNSTPALQDFSSRDKGDTRGSRCSWEEAASHGSDNSKWMVHGFNYAAGCHTLGVWVCTPLSFALLFHQVS